MFVTFTSNAYENISYFTAIAKKLLQLMGHSGTVPGAIKAVDIPEALANLQQGLAQSESKSHTLVRDNDEDPEINLANRAVPLLHLLEASAKEKADVLWDSAHFPT
jgi:hypothetical protein